MKWDILDIDGSCYQDTYALGKLTAKLLAASDLNDEKIREILNTDMVLSTSHADCVLQACRRIQSAKENHEKVFVGGDYDADGICSTAIMKKTLDQLGIVNGYYIPDRFKEGYGLNRKTVELVHEKGYTLIITVDNGVKAHEALQRAKELGMDVIVTDHHEIEEEVEADILVHPDFMEEEYRYLSGAGVAYEISRNLIGDHDQSLVTMCMVALIGDVMPLYRETRKIVKRGLQLLSHGVPRSLSLLLYHPSSVTETDVAFSVVPKLNSIGRMKDSSNVNTLVSYLLCEDEAQLISYSKALSKVNDERKKLSASMSQRAELLLSDRPFEIISDVSFEEGICGLVAGRLSNAYHKPVIVMSDNGEVLKGSGRSVPGFDLFSFLSPFEKKVAFGGHRAAVGITVNKSDFEELVTYVNENIQNYELKEENRKAILIHPEDVTFDSVADLSLLSPYPKDMAEPDFAFINPENVQVVKAGKTVRYLISAGNRTIECVAFPSRNLKTVEKPEKLIGKLTLNRFRGTVKLTMNLEYVE